MRAAVVQFTSGSGIDANLERMERLLEEAVSKGAGLVAFPEMAYLQAKRDVWVPALPRFDELMKRFSGWAKGKRIHLLPGSLREAIPGVTDRCFNTSPLFGPDGRLLARYRKIFLFRARLPDRVYDESVDCMPGMEMETASLGGVKLGLSICYDLRFPELFRSLKKRGATVVALPSSFTVPTGQAHWDALTKARAIENQIFFLAPGQVGALGNGATAYGHSRILSPWGEVLAEIVDGEGVAVADLDPSLAAAARTRVDAWESRRDDLFPIA